MSYNGLTPALVLQPPVKDSPSSQRIIKKYPNRRLYDTETSAYITMAEIKQLVLQHAPLRVLDVKTGEDLTRSVLLQIILEEETFNGTPLFTAPVLAHMIRFYGHAMQGMVGTYLEKNVQALLEIQAPMVQQMQEQMQKQTEQFLQTLGLKR
jgi:polyhydroxyalkanoate synthesis repressor PhaR